MASRSRRTSASVRRITAGGIRFWSGSSRSGWASTSSCTSSGANASRASPIPVQCSGILPPTRYRTGTALCEENRSTRVASMPLAHRELHVLLGHRGEVAHERQRDLAQAVAARRERGDLEQPQPDRVPPVLVALKRAPGEQPAGQPQRRADRDAAAPAQLAQRQHAVAGVERREQRERPVDDRLALRRALAPDPLAARLGRSRHDTTSVNATILTIETITTIAFHSMASFLTDASRATDPSRQAG